MTEDKPMLRTIMTVLAALLIFAGPTYLIYALIEIVGVEYFLSMSIGFAAMLAGVVLLLFLMRRKIIS